MNANISNKNQVARITYILFYICYYPIGRLLILCEYIPSRLFEGYIQIWKRWGICAGLFGTLLITSTLLTGIPLLGVWLLGKKAYYRHYEKNVEDLHADWYRHA
jgi:hypothetical protein